MKTAIFSLENVLLNTDHRKHLLPKFPDGSVAQHWNDYLAQAHLDKPTSSFEVALTLNQHDWHLIILASRPAWMQQQTESQLAKLGLVMSRCSVISRQSKGAEPGVYTQVLTTVLNKRLKPTFGLLRDSGILRGLRADFPEGSFLYLPGLPKRDAAAF